MVEVGVKEKQFTRYNARDVAKMMNCSHVVIYAMIKNGRIPYHKFNKRAFFTEEDVAKILDSTRIPAKAEQSMAS